MADNVTFATQDEGGIHFPEIKLVASGTGTTAALSKAEDTAHTTGDHGLVLLAVRRDAAAVGSDTDGDYSTLNVDNQGLLRVRVDAGSAAGPSYTEGAVDATIDGVAIMWEDTGDTLRAVSAAKPLPVSVAPLPAGSNAIGTLGPNSGVDIGDVDVTSVLPGSGALNLGKLEDSAHTSGDVGVMVLGVRRATATDLSAGGTDGDYEPFQLTDTGSLRVHVESTSTGSATETEDGTIADGLSNVAVVASFPYSHDGDNWTRAGATIFRSIDLDETEEEIKASAGVLYGYDFSNVNAAGRYLHFYNATAANVTVGTTTSVYTLYLPAESSGHFTFGPTGLAFPTAITAAATTDVAGSGAPGLNDVLLMAFYK